MDHPCETCAHPVEDGIPFCPHCRAPQIRVVVLEVENGGSPLGRSGSASVSIHPNSIQWALALPVCASAGILAGFLMALAGPSILWMLAAGFFSVFFYRRRHPAINPKTRIGARLGGASGVIALAVFFAAAVYNGLLREMLSQTVNFYSTMKSDPRFKDVAQSSIDALRRPGGLGAWLFFISLVMFIFFVIGGALGAAILGRRDHK